MECFIQAQTADQPERDAAMEEPEEFPLGRILLWIAGVGGAATALVAALLWWGFD